MKKGFYMIASNNGIMEPVSGTFELHYPLMVNRREGHKGASWSVSHIQTGRAISASLRLTTARSLAKAIKHCKVWEVSITTDDIHEYLASETHEKDFIMKERDKAYSSNGYG